MDQDVYGNVNVYMLLTCVCTHMIVPAFKYRLSRWRGGRDMCTHTQEGGTCVQTHRRDVCTDTQEGGTCVQTHRRDMCTDTQEGHVYRHTGGKEMKRTKDRLHSG